MKAYYQIAALMLIAGLGFQAQAQFNEKKAPTRIDFNRMINDNNNTRSELKKDIDQKANAAASEEDDAQVATDKKKVVDFVDVEVGWGENPPVVDRRFDSVGEARPYKMNEEDLQPKESGS